MRHLEQTICTLCMYHSLNVCLCDIWTEDMARSRSMTLRDTNIPRISLCFCQKKFDRCICTYQRLFFVGESVMSWNIQNDFFSACLFQFLAWLGLALLARIFTIIHENLGESCWGSCLKLSESSFKVLTQQTFLFSATWLQTFALLLLVELQTSQ